MWMILKKNRRGEFVAKLSLSAGLAALNAFETACDDGTPGDYMLRSDNGVDLASAVVQKDEMAITWRKPWILWAIGREGIVDSIDQIWAFLEER